jgi:hypothetical protein
MSPISHYTKLRQFGAQLIHADRQNNITKPIATFRVLCERTRKEYTCSTLNFETYYLPSDIYIYIYLPHHWSGCSFAVQISLYFHSQSQCIRVYKTSHSQKRFPSKCMAYVKNAFSKFTNLNKKHISHHVPLFSGTSTVPFVAACQVWRLCLYEPHLN